jgi:hypothetical protein
LQAATIENLSVDQPEKLKEVFFGGEPWVISCYEKDGASHTFTAIYTQRTRASLLLPDGTASVFGRRVTEALPSEQLGWRI